MSFTDSFWTSDYNVGCRILFEQLYEGVKENEAYVKLFEKRSDSELIYGNSLLGMNSKSISSLRLHDDNYVSSIKNAYHKINENFVNQGTYHVELSETINAKIVSPFGKWCNEHKERIEYSDSVLTDKYKAYKSARLSLDKVQKRYFNKCRILEEFKANFDEEDLNDMKKFNETVSAGDTDGTEEDDFDEVYKLGDLQLSEANLKSLLKDLLKQIDIKDHKVAILGTYQNVSSGSAISHWLMTNVPELKNDIDGVEKFGHDLVAHEFIRSIGTINNNKNFINSSQYHYQWKPKTFDLVGYENLDDELSRSSSMVQNKNQFSDYFEDMKQVMGVNSVDFNDKTQYAKIHQDVKVLDQQYFQMTMDLDKLRCEFEELIMDHLSFMEKCEFDRLKAIRKVVFDFLNMFQTFFKDDKVFLDELLILEETINPLNDLKFFIENFKIGKFKPVVELYDNYYDSNINQTFGVDLTIKSRLDKKVVPVVIQCILSHLDKVYPDLINDSERVNLWIKPVSLSNIHSLRFQLNHLTTHDEISEVLSTQHPMIITNTLKLYLLELPDSLISSSYFEIIKSLYLNYPINTNNQEIDNQRLNGLQNVLIELPKCNLATLDAILTHLNRLVQIIGKKDEDLAKQFKIKLSKEFSSSLIIPKHHDQFLPETFQHNLMMDLFDKKETIFRELRRNNSTQHSHTQASHTQASHTQASHTQASHSSSSSVKKTKPSNSPSTPAPAQIHVKKTPKAPAPAPISSIDDSMEMSNVTDFDDTFSEIERPPQSRPLDSPGPLDNPDGPGPFEAEKENKYHPQTPKPIEKDLPPITPQSAANTPGLRRSTSPNKKSLNSYLDKQKIISSKPSKRDIDVSDFAQPKFAGIGRRPSVKDLASKFDSPSPSPNKSSSSSTKSN